MKKIFSIKNIADYDLFGTSEIKGIDRAIQVSDKRIEIFISSGFRINNIQLFRISYNPGKSKSAFDKKSFSGFSAEHKEQKIIIVGDFNLQYNYNIKLNENEIPVILDPKPNGILDTNFIVPKHEELGVHINNDNTVTFKVWSPPAININLILYSSDNKRISTPELKLKKKGNGIHSLVFDPKEIGIESIEGYYYQYEVFAYDRRQIALDPYALSMAPFDLETDPVGKAAIIKMPELYNRQRFRNSEFIENPVDIIAYEMHVRDFTIEPNCVSEDIAGTYSGVAAKVGYLSDLGITHLQLMPVHKCHTQNDNLTDFQSKDTKESNYNWGYDPLNYFTLEGRYAQEPDKPEQRIKEFQLMTEKLHKKGVGLILDVVFNHAYSANTFENIAPGCYYRFNDKDRISTHTGAGPSLESRRTAVRKLIIDVLIYYVKYLGADGFRFDLMEFTDSETLKQIRKKAGFVYNPKNIDDLILWGEAWDFKDIDYKESFTKSYHPKGLNISMFNDVMRDSALGKKTEGGFFQGRQGSVSGLASAVCGGLKTYDADNFPFCCSDFFHPYNLFAAQPADCLNFLSIHDGLTLWDKINLTIKDPSKQKRLKIAKQSLLLLLTSQGRIILNGGTEILRSKPVIPLETKNIRALSTEFADEECGTKQFHDNPYKSVDYTNMIRWSRLNNNFSEETNSLTNFLKGIIKIRRTISAFRHEDAKNINSGLRFLKNENDSDISSHNIHFNSFKSHKLHKLHMKFINGPCNDILFLVGEVHTHSHNPIRDSIPVKFDNSGTAIVSFTRKQIEQFDLEKWKSDSSLDVKLVRTPGKWDTPQEYYSKSGSNSLDATAIDKNYEITIDLSAKDFSSYKPYAQKGYSYLAYSLVNFKPEKETGIKSVQKFFIVHNTSDTVLKFKHSELNNYSEFLIYADAFNCSITALKYNNSKKGKEGFTSVKVENGELSVPGNSSVIVGALE